MTDPRVLIGIDAGGSKLQLRAADLEGRVLGDVVRSHRTWTALPTAAKARLIAEEIGASAWPRPAAVGIGAHGCDTDDQCAELQLAVATLINIPVVVVNDALLLQHAVGRPNSANLVLGTGSILLARDRAGRTLYASGWGWLFGDHGSAWGLVREAVRAAAAAEDAGDPDDVLVELLIKHTGQPALREIVQDLLLRLPPAEWATWAPVVFTAAERGSTAARTAIEAAVDQLVRQVGELTARGAVIDQVVAGGGVIARQPDFERALARRLQAALGLELIVVREPPVAGAVRLAYEVRPDR
ncbi:N-acetylglucosamine kinase [Microlunatus speluncae]|uniref:N-acetylglucosamine kinase n=1 Tax=Microlunatus speluncae TaxID=2594267 RepID=UPI00126651A6|nr:ATPase [Microlunatus speluncae]